MSKSADSERRDPAKIPRARFPDSTLPFLLDPYGFVSRMCAKRGSELFETRLQLERVICMTGKDAAKVFYDTTRFMRDGAAPRRIQKTLFGVGGVQGLDDEAHRHRKTLFLSIVEPERVAALARLSLSQWETAAQGWEKREQVTLYDASREVLTRAVCAWSGVPLNESEVDQRVAELSALYDAAGSIGLRHWKARRDRSSAEKWARELIGAARSGKLKLRADQALSLVASHVDERGRQLDLDVAAVELLNVLRPTVAVSVYIAFVALALHRHPDCRERIRSGDVAFLSAFAQETRRYYPFFPVVAARVRRDFEWRGFRFPQGRLVILDLYGINHDEREWERPDTFLPERFLSSHPGCPFSFVPQGGGDAREGHRCPGEGVAVELMKGAADFLMNRIRYTLPEQDLTVDRRRLPALPRSRIVMTSVRRL